MKEIIIAVISLVAGGFIGPYINWGIEKRKQKLAKQRELVNKWRRMVEDGIKRVKANNEDMENNDTRLIDQIENTHDFYSLIPYIQGGREILRQHSGDRDLTHFLIDEIGRIEKEWKLV